MIYRRISPSLLEFLKDLKRNNNRTWFNEHKERYQESLSQINALAKVLLQEMQKYDHIESCKVFRIYRDIRFSKDKTPFHTGFGGRLRRATMLLRGGYYFHLEPGNTLITGGFWRPNADDLKRLRQEIAYDDKPLRKILAEPVFIQTFGRLEGEKLKTAPQGYSTDHPAIDLLRRKQFLLHRSFTDEEVISSDFLQHVILTYKKMRPFFDYMSDVLTTDANGRLLRG